LHRRGAAEAALHRGQQIGERAGRLHDLGRERGTRRAVGQLPEYAKVIDSIAVEIAVFNTAVELPRKRDLGFRERRSGG
jgi:hypothetical protein